MAEEQLDDIEVTDKVLRLLHEMNKDQLSYGQLLKRLESIPIKSLIIVSHQINKFKTEFDGLRRLYHIKVFKSPKEKVHPKHNKSMYDLCNLSKTKRFHVIPQEFSSVTIPLQIRECIASSDVYYFMVKSIFVNDGNCIINNGMYRIFDFNFHDGEGHPLYGLAYILNGKWQMMDKLFSHNDLWSKYKVDLDEHILKKSQSIKQHGMIMKWITEQLMNVKDDIIDKTKWSGVPIYRDTSNKNKRVTLSMLNKEFMSHCHDYIELQQNDGGYSIIPIVIFDSNGRDYHIEYVWIISIEFENINIGISFICNSNNSLRVTGIHLDKTLLQQQHLLVATRSCANSSSGCHCFDNFSSYIDDLRIGNIDTDQNKTKDFRARFQKAQQELDTLGMERKSDLRELKVIKQNVNRLETENRKLKQTNKNLETKHKKQEQRIEQLEAELMHEVRRKHQNVPSSASNTSNISYSTFQQSQSTTSLACLDIDSNSSSYKKHYAQNSTQSSGLSIKHNQSSKHGKHRSKSSNISYGSNVSLQ
mmetsp:Transcript_73038/g.65710  ORF Transcript_73038/g.65710 Transcript_73038/m.65710 type:complete len:531 (+) Transcript_73038:1151-2743(+)